jgi:hypothetical protein
VASSKTCGEVLVMKTTPTAMTANATTPTTILITAPLKSSPNTHTPRMMLTRGSIVTITGWEMLKGPVWRAAWVSIAPAAPVRTTA